MMSAGSAREETCFLFLDAAYRITDAIGDSRRLYPELPQIQVGDALRDFIVSRINAGYVGLNESLNIKSASPLETRMLELASYTLFRTYQIGPRGQVLVATHARSDEDCTILTVTPSHKQVDLGNSDRFRRSASILDFDVTVSGLTGFGLVEHIAYSIINSMAVPLIVLNGDGLVLAANEAAQRVFKQGRLTVDVRDRLTLAEGSVGPLLTFLQEVEFGSIVPLPAFQAQGFHYARAINTPPLGKIFVLALEDSSSPPDQIEMLRRRHPALSQGEAEVALLLLSGAPPKRIAQERDASIHTVRTQVASILKKTNCHSVSAFIAVSRMASL